MLTDNQRWNILEHIVKYYGEESQLGMVSEECGELLQAVNKYRRAGTSTDKLKAIISAKGEIADVAIMILQLMLIFDIKQKDLLQEIDYKLLRMKRRMDEDWRSE